MTNGRGVATTASLFKKNQKIPLFISITLYTQRHTGKKSQYLDLMVRKCFLRKFLWWKMNSLLFTHLRKGKSVFERPGANMDKMYNQLPLVESTDILIHERDSLAWLLPKAFVSFKDRSNSSFWRLSEQNVLPLERASLVSEKYPNR